MTYEKTKGILSLIVLLSINVSLVLIVVQCAYMIGEFSMLVFVPGGT